ncbi:sterol desaturase family protein [Pseudoalteromonas byunsanensis]|nr:sterol desaturase family protein [Pseudoalteromonas byunsanensis]
MQWPFLLGALSMAICFVYLYKDKSLLDSFKFIFCRKIWFHKSAVTDYKIAIINGCIYAVLLPTSLFSSFEISTVVHETLTTYFGESNIEQHTQPALWATLLFSLFIILIVDFVSYLVHFLYHKVPFLWEFHKVHHSARVLTPVSSFRTHPVSNWLGLIVNGILIGMVFGLLKYFVTFPVSELSLFGLNVFSFFINLFGGLLTHSHIRIQWPANISKVIVSPLNHQIHHSNNPAHFDKNFGFWFSIWDVIFGTYYKGTEQDKFAFGIGKETKDFYSLKTVYFRPVKNALQIAKQFFKSRQAR